MSAPLAALESSVLEQLRSAIMPTELAIEPYPEKPSEYQLLHPKGVLLVFVQGSRYGNYSNGAMLRSTRLVITLLIRNFSQHQEAYDWIDAVQALLFGFIPDGWQPIKAVSDQFISESSGVWQYDLIFETTRLTTSQFDLCPLTI